MRWTLLYICVASLPLPSAKCYAVRRQAQEAGIAEERVRGRQILEEQLLQRQHMKMEEQERIEQA